MPTHVRLVSLVCSLALALLSGCAAGYLAPPQFTYDAAPAATPIAATAAVQVRVNLDPGMQAFWQANIAGGAQVAANAISDAIHRDLTQSNLFTTIPPPDAGDADYWVVVTCDQVSPENVTLRMKLSLLDRTGKEIFARRADKELGVRAWRNTAGQFVCETIGPVTFPGDIGPQRYSFPGLMAGATRQALSQIMPVLKSGVSDRLLKTPTKPAAPAFDTATLPELIAGSDPHPEFARARNHALVAAKTTQLPALLRKSTTDELTQLVIKAEQTILDLQHGSELLKDRAQQALAAGSSAGEEFRSLALYYRERAGVLDAVVRELKAEIANRNR